MSTVRIPQPSDNAAERPPQFRLITLLAGITALSILFAVMSAVGLYSSLVLAMFLCLVMAHVVGNALGTRLRDQSPSRLPGEPSGGINPPATDFGLAVSPARRLVENSVVSRTTRVSAGLGALVGAIAGGIGLAAVEDGRLSAAAMTLGIFSSAVLGGLAGFLVSSFVAVFGGALREAHDERPTRP